MSNKNQNTIDKFIEYFEGKKYICEFSKNKIGEEIYKDVISTMNRLKILYELELEEAKSQVCINCKKDEIKNTLKEINK